MKRILFLSVTAVSALILSSHSPMTAANKVDICHVPPGNPANVQLISVGAPAVPAHLAHGDYFPNEHGHGCVLGDS